MSTQLTLNQFDALTLSEKLAQFGNKFFTAKQCMILKSMVAFNESSLDSEDIANDLDLSKRSVSSTISSLNRKIQGLIDVDHGWSNEAYYTLDNDALSSVICIDELIEMGAIDFTEETPAQEITEETPAQETTQAIIEKAQHVAADNDQPLIQLESTFNSAIIGFTANGDSRIVLIYSFQTLINLLIKSLRCEESEAVEYFDYNLTYEDVFINYT
jgi:hypothetical protein